MLAQAVLTDDHTKAARVRNLLAGARSAVAAGHATTALEVHDWGNVSGEAYTHAACNVHLIQLDKQMKVLCAILDTPRVAPCSSAYCLAVRH